MESVPSCLRLVSTAKEFRIGVNNNNKNKKKRLFHSPQTQIQWISSPAASACYSKQSHFQDFPNYAKPARLLRAAELKVCTDSSVDKLLSSFGIGNGESQSLYTVMLCTSNFSSSTLSDSNAGVLLCLIDENGDSVLHRIPTTSAGPEHLDLLHFQRGSLDKFTFQGPKLGRLEAIWIGVESGQWRLCRVSLTVIHNHGCQQSLEKKDSEQLQYTGFIYEFEAEDIMLGEGTNVSMLELRPCRVTELSGADVSALFTKSLVEPTSIASASQRVSKEESLREYAHLKLSLLLYDAILICIGTLAASFWDGEGAALAFLTGGVVGFLYLLLLQRSVDGISAPASSTFENTGETKPTFEGFKGPISSLALAIGFMLFAVEYSSGDLPMVLTPKQLIVGMMGFLACKVAVLLAAFRPLENAVKVNK